MNRQPFIVGPTADRILGFLAGVLGLLVGVVATIVVMFVWAGSEPTPEVQARRDHARSVSIWSGLGCLLPLIVVVLGLAVFIGAASGGGGHGPEMAPPMPEFTWGP